MQGFFVRTLHWLWMEGVAMQALMSPDTLKSRDKKAVGARLRLTRLALGMDQGEFGSRAGVKSSAYNQMENGVNLPSLDAAHKLCDTYHLTLDWIYRGETHSLRRSTEAAIMALVMSHRDSET